MKKESREKVVNYMLNGKDTIIHYIARQIKKKTQYKLVSIFQSENLQKQCKVELDFSNYATKTDLKNATGVDTLEFAKKLIQLI